MSFNLLGPPQVDGVSGIDRLEEMLLGEAQVDIPVTHLFAPNIYVRQITVPAGSIIVGHMHRTANVNNVVRGRALVSLNGEVSEMAAPAMFVSEAGVRKAALVTEELVWQSIHVIDMPDPPTTPEGIEAAVALIEPEIIEKSHAWLEHQQQQLEEDMKSLVQASDGEGAE